MKQIRKRLTYANVMSSIAVFLVLGGATALAAGQLGKNSVGSKQIKKNAVTTAKIKNNAVTTGKIQNGAITGAKVNLGSLGTVPNATHANSADSAGSAGSAGNANTVGGVGAQEISFSANSGTQTIYDRSGLRITASCSGDDVTIIATTSKENSSIYTTVVDTDSLNNNFNEDEETEAFSPGEDFDLLAGNDGNPGLATFAYDAKDGSTVNGTFSADESADPDCQVHGVVFDA
ncbi:MAG: hypothetical protein E6G51_03110 [Actinobacteria bacterium]|nr:MAG: hypothetical protein E6G51_03110 [Actinomycetota bacterium]